MSGYLLDTHTLIWWMTGGRLLPARVRKVIEDEAATIFASAVNAFEIATKHRSGRLPVADTLMRHYERHLDEQGFSELAVSAAHALVAGALEFAHRDPFDRLLIAQAKVEELTLLSNEGRFDETGVSRLWE